jgi:hypothetical protein
MKKKIISIVFLVAIAIAAAWGFSQNQDELALSDLTLENVEALASCETIAGSCWLSYYTWKCCDAGDVGCSPCD